MQGMVWLGSGLGLVEILYGVAYQTPCSTCIISDTYSLHLQFPLLHLSLTPLTLGFIPWRIVLAISSHLRSDWPIACLCSRSSSDPPCPQQTKVTAYRAAQHILILPKHPRIIRNVDLYPHRAIPPPKESLRREWGVSSLLSLQKSFSQQGKYSKALRFRAIPA